MSQSNKRWIIRDAEGRVDGPFSTEKVLYKIGRGEFSGEEYIAHYPNGKWIAISQDPQFYDKLLDVISAEDAESGIEETHILDFTRPEGKDDENEADKRTRISYSGSIREDDVPTDPGGGQTRDPGTGKASGADDGPVPIGTVSVKPKAKKKRGKKRSRPMDIELVDVRPQVLRQIVRRARLPVLVALAGLVVSALFWARSGPEEQRLHLVGPQRNIAQASPDALKSRMRQGLSAFLKDTLDGYIQAQNEFVYIVERNGKSSDTMALLCMTYLRLWPYSYQDSADSKVITGLVQMSSTIDPAGQNAATCRTVDLIVRGRYQEAKNMVESVLDTRSSEANPPIIFYFLKGDLLEGSGDHTSAVGYLRSAEQLWPQWQLPYMVRAQALAKMEKYSEAAHLYMQVLKNNPAHTVARIEFGLIEYKNFNHPDQGEKYLRQALENEDAPKPTLSRGYFGLAEIYLHKGNQKKALSYAQKAFSLNSANNSAKNLVVQLGGQGKLKNTRLKGQQLLFEGDQFFREGDYHAAQAHYKAAFEEDSKNAVAAMKAAQCLWKLSFSTEAIDWLDRAIKSDPKFIDAYVTLAEYQAQRFNFLAAERILEQAKRINPKSSEVFRGFATVELKRGNTKGALAFGKHALELYENDVETLIVLAKAALAQRDPKMGYNYAAKAIEIDVNNRQAQIVYAQALAGLQGVDTGIDYFLRLVNNYPAVSEYRVALGQMLVLDERYQQAEEIFRQIIKLEEKPKEAYVELAKVLRAEGEMGQALDLLLKAAVLDPSDAEPLYLAGLIYLEQHKSQEATVQFKRVLVINKLYPLVNYELGHAALMQNDPKGALTYTDLEKKSNPGLPEAYLLAAEAHTLLGQYTLCAREYGKAIKLRPQSASVYVKLATCDRKAGQIDAAVGMLNVAATKENGLAAIYKEQGAIYELKGDVNHAIEAYQQYFALDPEAPDRAQIEERIEQLQRGKIP